MRALPILVALTALSAAYGQKDWPTTGGDLAGTRYSTLKQIDAKNVSKLERAWTSLHVFPTESDRQNFDAVCAKYNLPHEAIVLFNLL